MKLEECPTQDSEKVKRLVFQILPNRVHSLKSVLDLVTVFQRRSYGIPGNPSDFLFHKERGKSLTMVEMRSTLYSLVKVISDTTHQNV